MKLKMFMLIIIATFAAINANADDRFGLMPLEIIRHVDGFSANGKRYIDPRGRIEEMSEISDTGYITYLIQGKENQYIVKMVAPLGIAKPVELGKLEYRNSQWHFLDSNHEQYSGDRYILLSRGLILIRGNSVLSYVQANNEIKAFALPEHFIFSPYQKGDIAYTKLVLIQRQRVAETERKSILGTFTTKIGQGFEFAFYNIETGQIIETFSMPYSLEIGKQIDDIKHRLYLFNTSKGTLMVRITEDFKEVIIKRIGEKKEVIAFQRKWGIANFNAEKDYNGKINLKATLAFKTKTLDDAEKFYDESK